MEGQRSARGQLPGEAPPPVGEGILGVDAITHVPLVLREVGLDPAETLAATGLDPKVFDDPVNEIPIASLGRLLALAVALSGCDHLGLLVGERSGVESLGLIGLLTRHSPNLGSALRNFTAHLHLRDRGAVATLSASNGIASLGYEIYQAGVEACDQICDGAIAIAMKLLRGLCGPAWRPTEVRFAHRPRQDLRPYRRIFDAPLHFDAERTAILFPTKWLEQRTPGADPTRYRKAANTIAELESAIAGDFVAELRRMLRVILLSGKGSVAEIAERLAIHRRTLNRRLRARGTSLHELVEETRFEIARQLVQNTSMPLTEISATLGYADASAFTRAFRRWTGGPPSDRRKESSAVPVAKRQAPPPGAPYAGPPRPGRGRNGRPS